MCANNVAEPSRYVFTTLRRDGTPPRSPPHGPDATPETRPSDAGAGLDTKAGPEAGPGGYTNLVADTVLRPPNVILVLSDSVMVLDPPEAAMARSSSPCS